MARPLMEKTRMAMRSKRMSSTERAFCSGGKPGAMRVSISQGARRAMRAASRPVVMKAKLRMRTKSSQDADKEIPGSGAAAPLHIFRENGDEGDAQRAAGDKCREQIGDVVGGVEYIQFVAEPKLVVDQELAHKGEEFIDAEEKGNEQGGASEMG